ncbi:molybdenum cofactor biosynthesis protein MoaE [Leifsonia sp. LS1]|uniref:molybdenum cofactor biosynthesis protein MoaE n=1 Tax=unclassified Leifsonia TaxID=2663824 RepID=UPI001CBE7602|nr:MULTISPECIES: molybdenum cofactor biosynthesis protein MoaE [unclassified Leifsonia]UAJ80905.1 molybdenum cofactor biosynthesis protein MoaE [Leifsonia sp. ZF2019]GIT82044.1 molybdenum cofactor biosynthesis protein MoaE [Leifsonia sp. LS1]
MTAAGAVLAEISAATLDPGIADEFVWRAEAGAVVCFHGIVRDHDGGQAVVSLDYRAHPDAESFLRACCEEVAARTGLRVAAQHRVGSLRVGDLALVAAVAAPHRAEAFAACAELVEAIKAGVPIWKRQHFATGASEWVGL